MWGAGGPDLARAFEAARAASPFRRTGRVRQVVGLAVESRGPSARIGEVCSLRTSAGPPEIFAEVVGFRDRDVLLLPLGDMEGIEAGSTVVAHGRPLQVGVGPGLLGRVVNAFGQPIDNHGPILVERFQPLVSSAPGPLDRTRVTHVLGLGVRAIDGPLTCGKGQRIGIFAGSGVGKSALLGMVARNTSADVNVIALVGERGREVREFIERDLGDGLERSVVVVATSEQPPLVRLKAAFAATTMAEYFRDEGHDVMLMMDSITRAATARREVGLAVGEPPTTRGYTPSVFAMLPQLLERAGTSRAGTITGLYAVLVEADDLTEPVADSLKAILDGHIVLSRRIASEGRYPAVDVLASVSRVMNDIVSPEHRAAANALRSVLATYAEHEDLIAIGAYQRGTNPGIDDAVARVGEVRSYLSQGLGERAHADDSLRALLELFPGAHKAAGEEIASGIRPAEGA
jgi:flagellum-specific ATP synthase